MKEENKEKKKTKNKVNRKKIVMYIVLALVIMYLVYAVYLLVKQPTDKVTVENGTLYLEETDIGYIIRDEHYVATVITEDDLTKTSRQLKLSMGEVMNLFLVFGVIMSVLLIYLLSKIIIEKNTVSISMTKILGYTEIPQWKTGNDTRRRW